MKPYEEKKMTQEIYCFKGGPFINRYRIDCKLLTLSPLHIGDGEMDSNPSRLPRPDGMDRDPKFSTVVTNIKSGAYIPGSTIKGNLRAWLEQIFSGLNSRLAQINDTARSAALLKIAESKENGESGALTSELKTTEYLFGSHANEGKLEFWDAPMASVPALPRGRTSAAYCGYDATRGTILLKSVAIDPVKGTAAKNKLFNYEVVPEGVGFDLTVVGQNLLDEEIGMLLFALKGVNSFIHPVTLGAMAGVGFGRFSLKIKDVYTLNKSRFDKWVEEAIKTGHAGYASLPKLEKEEKEKRIEDFKNSFLSTIKKEG